MVTLGKLRPLILIALSELASLALWQPAAALGQEPVFVRGDSDGDGEVVLSDAVFTLNYLFLGGAVPSCLDAADANDDGELDIADPILTLIQLFLEEAGPTGFFNRCAVDQTIDTLNCVLAFPCAAARAAVIVLDPKVMTVAEVTDNSIILSGMPPDIQVGAVLVSGVGMGLLRRVESTERNPNGTVLVHTSQATLEDVFEEAQITLERDLRFDDWDSFEPAIAGVTLTKREAPEKAGGRIDVNLPDTNLTLSLEERDSSSDIAVRVSGSIALKTGFFLDLKVGRANSIVPRLEHFLFEPRLTVDGSLGIEVVKRVEFLEFKKFLGRRSGKPITVFVAGIPVIFHPVLDIFLRITGTFEAGLQLTPTASLHVKGGLEYSPADGWRNYRTIESSFDFSPVPRFLFAFEGRVSPASQDLSLLIYDVAGPFARLDLPYFSARLERKVFPPPPQWEFSIEAGVTGSIGAKVDVLGIEHESPSLFDLSTNITKDTYPAAESVSGFTSLGSNAQGYPEYRHDQTGSVFVWLPGAQPGQFLMGSPEGECGRQGFEGPVHEVALSPFLIAKYECTQAVWVKVMGSNPAIFNRGEEYPVEMVSWDDIQAFNMLTGLQLPSEAQWEYACRGGTKTPFAFGVVLDSITQGNFDAVRADPCNYSRGNQYLEATVIVGSYNANSFGIHDMHGNVWEWCLDFMDLDFYGKTESRGPDPVNSFTAGTGDRVLRGGGYQQFSQYCRSAFRNGGGPGTRFPNLGFRPVAILR